MGEVVYALCALTSLICAGLLLRGYVRTRTRLLLWSCLCFVGLAVHNVILFLDVVVLPDVDFGLSRYLSALIAMGLLLFGLIWDLV